MNILLVDRGGDFLDFAMRCTAKGHNIKWWIAPKSNGDRQKIGDGLGMRVSNYHPHMQWADLVLVSDNTWYMEQLDGYRRKGFPVIAPSPEAAALELDRLKGQDSFEKGGLGIMPFEAFTNYDDGIAYTIKAQKRLVSKPSGDADKALSYVSQSPRDLISMLTRWKRLQKGHTEFVLQEYVPGIEMAVGGWFGPGGFNRYVLENFEFKKLMNDNLGCNTGEQGCYDAETEVLTASGWKYWPDITMEDSLATLVDNKYLQFVKPSAVVCYDVKECSMVRWRNRSIDILITPNHNMYVQRQVAARQQLDEYEFIQAEDCTQSQYEVKRIAEWQGYSPENYTLPGNVWHTGIGERYTEDIHVPFSQWASFLGIYFAEGSTSNGQVNIAQSTPHKAELVKGLLDNTPFDYHQDGLGFRISCSALARVTKLFGRSYEKRVPDYIKSATKEDIKRFLDAFAIGDAHTQENGSRLFYTSNARLADDLQELMLRCGMLGVIKELKGRSKPSYIDGREIHQRRPAFVVYERAVKIKSWLDARDKDRVCYTGKVYCAEVPSHVLFVRRNGKPMWCGNTVIKYVPKEESKIFQETLAKVEDQLHRLDYVGYIDIAVIVDKAGRCRPLEYTARFGWPAFQIQQALHREPVEFMKDLLEGRDTFRPYKEVAVGVVVTIPDFPYSHLTNKEVSGYPVYNIDDENKYRDNLHPCSLQWGEAPNDKGKLEPCFISAGDYLLVGSGTGKTVVSAKEGAYASVESVEVPNSKGYRTDIGDRLERELPILQKYGYATEFKWN